MSLILSNALCAAWNWLAAAPSQPTTSPAASRPASAGETLEMVVFALGLCVLIVYVVIRCMRPKKLRLTLSPGRPNHVNPLHAIFAYGLFLTMQVAGWWGFAHLWGLPLDASGQPAQEASSQPAMTAVADHVRILTVVLSQSLWLVGLLVLARKLFRGGLRRGMGLSARHWFLDGLRGIVAYLAVFPVCLGVYWLTKLLPGVKVHPLLEAMPQVGAGWKALALLSAIVLAPLTEEIFYRGLVQSMLRRYMGGPWPAVLLTSVFFALAHWGLWHTMPAIFVLGVVLGYNYERSGRLLAPMLAHALFNGVTMVSLLLGGT